jgi:hypothetical protein
MITAAEEEGVAVATPRPGQRIESGSGPIDPWWRTFTG